MLSSLNLADFFLSIFFFELSVMLYQFIHLGSNISSSESNVTIRIYETGIDRLLTIWKSYCRKSTTSFMLYLHQNCNITCIQKQREDTRWELHENARCCFEQTLQVKPLKIVSIESPSPKPSK